MCDIHPFSETVYGVRALSEMENDSLYTILFLFFGWEERQLCYLYLWSIKIFTTYIWLMKSENRV